MPRPGLNLKFNMIVRRIQNKGILVKLLEKIIRVLLKKECKTIGNLKIDIVSSSSKIIKGEIQKINIIAKEINYKDLIIDEFELEANQLKINFKLINKELYFKNNPIINFKILLSQNSLRRILISDSWNWIGSMIRKEISSQNKLQDISIRNDELLIKASEKNRTINQEEKINIKVDGGRIYLENRNCNKIIQIPLEDKIYINNVNIENNLIIICANSEISF